MKKDWMESNQMKFNDSFIQRSIQSNKPSNTFTHGKIKWKVIVIFIKLVFFNLGKYLIKMNGLRLNILKWIFNDCVPQPLIAC